jgi:hypothetical protein
MPQVGGLDADAVTWDDLQAAASRLIRPGGSDPTWRTWDFGLGGPAFSVLGFAVGDYVDLWLQSKHAMRLLSQLRHHLHYTVPSNSAGDRFKFELAGIAAGVDESFAAMTGSPFSAEHTLVGDESAKHNVLGLANMPEVNTTVSTAYGLQLKRVAASASEYSGEVYLLFSDSHYPSDQTGSVQEYVKG